MLKTTVVMIAVVFVLSVVGAARAEELFGIQVYPGARKDAAADKFCNMVDPSGKYAVCFRTSDTFEKVAAFYKKQANLKAGMHLASEGMSFAAFCPKGQDSCPGFTDGVDVTLNSPWSANVKMPPNAKAGDFENKDVRIRIYNKEAQMKQFNQKQSK